MSIAESFAAAFVVVGGGAFALSAAYLVFAAIAYPSDTEGEIDEQEGGK